MISSHISYSYRRLSILSSFASLQFLLCSLENGLAMEEIVIKSSPTHTIPLHSILPATTCNSSSTEGLDEEAATLEVVHKRGPCSQFKQDKGKALTHTQSLQLDLYRMKSIDRRLLTNSIGASSLKDLRAMIREMKDGVEIGLSNYIVMISLGTPKQTLPFVLDTSADLTWTRCRRVKNHTFLQNRQAFFYQKSKSYETVSCNSTICFHLNSTDLGISSSKCTGSTCEYEKLIASRNKYYTILFGKDTLSLTPSDILDNFLFGCSHNSDDYLGNVAGRLGLGSKKISIVNQTAKAYKQIFSYCLPSTASNTGYLQFGHTGSATVKYIPLVIRNSILYGLDITGISIGGHQLKIAESVFPKTGTVIDSGVEITRLPIAAYNVMRREFVKRMVYPMVPGYSILDTCYDLTGHKSITIPKISFHFKGDVKIDIHPSGILYAVNETYLCLAFTKNHLDMDSVAILGNMMQKTLEVVYDVGGGLIGFGPRGCS